jgi:GH25 family lysozyme M1 (1,4-beta-N-acetylmuramidase)
MMNPKSLQARFRRFAMRAACVAATFVGATQARAATFIPGIDVYSGDGAVNWTSVKNGGYQFAFVKATEGVNFIDSRFNTNMTNANAAGVYVGPYHLARPDSKNGVAFTTYNGLALTQNSPTQTNRDAWEDATSEASDFLESIRPYYLQQGNTKFLRPVLDMELSKIPDFGSTSLEKTFVSNWVQIFSDAVQAALGVRPFMYLSKSNANTYWTSTIASQHAFWEAQYKGTGTTSPPTAAETPLWAPWSFWQWSDGTDAIAQANLVPGLSGSPDRDVFSGTMADLAALRVQLPEPTSVGLIGCGLSALVSRNRKR